MTITANLALTAELLQMIDMLLKNRDSEQR
jgi:hypothetical protein